MSPNEGFNSFYFTLCLPNTTFDILKAEFTQQKKPSQSSSKTQLTWEACECTIYIVCVFVCSSCYELRAVVKSRGESGIGDWPQGIMFFSLLLLTALMMACIQCIHE